MVLSDIKYRKLYDFYRAGVPLRTIASMVKRSHERVRQIAKEANIKRDKEEFKRYISGIIVKLYKIGLSVREIGIIMKMPVWTVREMLKFNNIKIDRRYRVSLMLLYRVKFLSEKGLKVSEISRVLKIPQSYAGFLLRNADRLGLYLSQKG